MLNATERALLARAELPCAPPGLGVEGVPLTLMPSLSQVFGPTTPSAVRPLAFWNAFTAAVVFGPNWPSAAPALKPSWLSRFWSAVTGAPLWPCLSVGPLPPDEGAGEGAAAPLSLPH